MNGYRPAVHPIVPPPVSRVVPGDVRTAVQIWFGVLAVGVVQLIASLIAQLGERQQLAEEMLPKMQESQPQATLAQVQVWVLVLLVLVALFWLALTGAGAAVVYQLWRGKSWARNLLTGYTVFLVLGAIGALIAARSTEGVAALVAGAAGIVQAVFAAGAVFLCYGKESDPYFRPIAQ